MHKTTQEYADLIFMNILWKHTRGACIEFLFSFRQLLRKPIGFMLPPREVTASYVKTVGALVKYMLFLTSIDYVTSTHLHVDLT